MHGQQHRDGVDDPALQKAQEFFGAGLHDVVKNGDCKMLHSRRKNKERFLVASRRRSRQICPSTMKIIFICWRVLLPPLAAFADGVVAPGAKLEKLAGGFAFTEGPTCDANGQRFFRGPAERPHHGMERGRKTFHLPPAVRLRERHVFRRAGKSHRLRGRTQPALVHRAGQDRDRAGHEFSGQISERPERRVGRAQRRDVSSPTRFTGANGGITR